MTPKTHTVESAYTGRDGLHRAYLKDQALPFTTDTLLEPGQAVVIQGRHAIRYFNHKDQ